MQQTLLEQGLDLMLFGMGAVCVFLTLLVYCTRFMSTVVTRYFPEQEPAIAPKAPTTSSTSQPVDATTLAVIQDAIRQHRAK